MSDIAELWRLQREKGVVQVPGSHGQETKDPRWGSQPGKGSLVPELMELIVILPLPATASQGKSPVPP